MANRKEMKKIWRREPWKWFWFNPDEVAVEAAEKGHNHWAQMILQCEALAMNRKYQVLIKTLDAPPFGEVAHLYIQRVDHSKIFPWTDLQRIKNEILGPSFTAVEVFPAEDELVDEIDMRHLWGLPKGVRMPFWIGDARSPETEWTFPGLPSPA